MTGGLVSGGLTNGVGQGEVGAGVFELLFAQLHQLTSQGKQFVLDWIGQHETVNLGVIIFPFLGWLAHDLAVAMAHGAALGFFVNDALAHIEAGVAAGIAQQAPTDRLAGLAMFFLVIADFIGVKPVKFAVVLACVAVKGQGGGHDFDHAADGVHLRAGQKGLFQ